MSSYAPHFGGGSLLQSSRPLTETQARFATESETCLMRRTIAAPPIATHSSWLAQTLDSAMLWLERANNAECDRFFSRAQDLYDLERRQRHFERSGKAHY